MNPNHARIESMHDTAIGRQIDCTLMSALLQYMEDDCDPHKERRAAWIHAKAAIAIAERSQEHKDTQRINLLERLANVKIWEDISGRNPTGRWKIHHDTEQTPEVVMGETLREALDQFAARKGVSL